jgi:hypothetical protein
MIVDLESEVSSGKLLEFYMCMLARHLGVARFFAGVLCLVILGLELVLPRLAFGQLPATRLDAIFPLGANPGTSVEVTVFGTDLDGTDFTAVDSSGVVIGGSDQLLFSHPGLTAQRKMSELGPFDKTPRPASNQFVVAVAANVPVGTYEVRAIGKYGASNPRPFAVSDVPEAVEVEPNEDRESATELTLPAVVNGQSDRATDVDFYHFTAPAGQRILVTNFARRVDSKADTVVSVYDSTGRALGSTGADQGKDSLVDFTTPVAGKYFVKVHDATYQGSPSHVYRVSIGVLPHIDFIFPPAGLAGGGRPFTIYGRNLPGGRPSGLDLAGRPLDMLDTTIAIPNGDAALGLAVTSRLEPASAAFDAIEYRIKGALGSSQPIMVGIATAPPVLENSDNDDASKAQMLTMPCEVMGKFYPERDRDWFQIDVKKDEYVSIEVISQRIGLPTNASLLVQRITPADADAEKAEQVQQLAYVFESTALDGGSEFDIRHHDASFQFTAPADGIYRLMVRGANADVSSDPRRSYRLAVNVRDAQNVAAGAGGDFRLAAVPEQSFASVLMRKGGQAGIRIVAFRRDGFAGEIRVTAAGLPAGVTCSDAILGPTSNVGMLVLTAAANAAQATALVQVIGKAKIGAAEVTRQARFGAALLPTVVRQAPNQNMPVVDGRLTRDLCVSVSAAEVSAMFFRAGEDKVWETSRAGKLTIPVVRGGTFVGQLNFMGRGLPGINFPVANVAANQTTGEALVTLTANIVPGTYSFYLDGIAQQVDYTRNPEAAAKAAERQKEVDEIKTKADADSKTAVAAKAAADKLVVDTTAMLAAANVAKTAADKAVVDVTTVAKTAADAAAAAVAAAAASPEDANLAAASVAAKKAADEAAAKVKIAMPTAVTAAKALVDGTTNLKSAADAKLVTDMTVTEMAQLAQLAAQLKTKTDQQAVALTNAAKPKKLNVPVVSTPITIKIVSAPVTINELPALTIKQGENVETDITIARLFAYEGQVNFNTVIPQGVAGLSLPNVAAPAKQSIAKLKITAAANATEGEHQLTVRGTLNLNGQNLIVEQPLRLIVEKAAPTE